MKDRNKTVKWEKTKGQEKFEDTIRVIRILKEGRTTQWLNKKGQTTKQRSNHW